VSEVLQVAGAVGAAAAVSAAILVPDRRLRAAAMVLAALLAAALIAGEAWDSQLRDLRDSPLDLAGILAAGLAALALLVALCSRIPMLLPLLLLLALPFRIPIHAGGETSNLLVPLYLMIAAGVVLECAAAWREPAPADGDRAGPAGRRGRWLAYALSASLVVYAAQSAYSSEISRAVQNLAFFLVPFALMFALLRDREWTPELLRAALLLVLAESLVFALVGIAQHEAQFIFWNDKVKESNEFDLYYRVNSLFWDPNIYGRYLSLAIVVGTGALLWINDARRLALGAAALAVIFAGMAFGFSQTSFLALLIGLAVLCALRWSLRWTLAGIAATIVAAALAFTFTDALTVDSQSGGELAQTTSGRSRLASGGVDLATARPLFGFGSGSFAVEFEKRNPVPSGEAVVSHTEPITVAAEQGALGLAVYAALLLAVAAVVFGGLREIAPGLGGRVPALRGPGSRRRAPTVARLVVAAAFAGLVIHTMGYAGFLIDPLAWALLAIGAALAVDRAAI
jgi:O-antigen ligase